MAQTENRRIIESLLSNLQQLSDDELCTELAYLKKGTMDDREAFHRLNIDDELSKAIVKNTKRRLIEAIEEALQQDDGLVDLSTTDLTRDTVGYFDISEFDKSQDSDEKIDNSLYELLSNFPGRSHEKVLGNNLKESASKISLIATSISIETDRLISICRQSKGSFIRSDNKIVVLVNEGKLKQIGDVFEIRYDTDFFLWGNFVWVLNEGAFESTFGLSQLVESKAENALKKIKNNLSIANVEDFIIAVKNGKRPLRSVSKLSGESHLDTLNNMDFMDYCKKNSIDGWVLNSNQEIELENHKSETINRFIDAIGQNYFKGGLGVV